MYAIDFLHRFVPVRMIFFRFLSLSTIFFMVSYRSKKLWWLLFPTTDKLSDVSWCPYGMTLVMALSKVSFDAVSPVF